MRATSATSAATPATVQLGQCRACDATAVLGAEGELGVGVGLTAVTAAIKCTTHSFMKLSGSTDGAPLDTDDPGDLDVHSMRKLAFPRSRSRLEGIGI